MNLEALRRFQRWANGFSSPLENGRDLPDDVTRDPQLRALRRQDRVNMEREEKTYLRAKILAYQRRVDSEAFSAKGNPLRSGVGFRLSKKAGGGRQSYLGRGGLL